MERKAKMFHIPLFFQKCPLAHPVIGSTDCPPEMDWKVQTAIMPVDPAFLKNEVLKSFSFSSLGAIDGLSGCLQYLIVLPDRLDGNSINDHNP